MTEDDKWGCAFVAFMVIASIGLAVWAAMADVKHHQPEKVAMKYKISQEWQQRVDVWYANRVYINHGAVEVYTSDGKELYLLGNVRVESLEAKDGIEKTVGEAESPAGGVGPEKKGVR